MQHADFIIFFIFQMALGLCVGSFLNVVIYRIPRGISIILPPSYCPACFSRIKWYDLIPFLSWFILNSKCRYCSKEISLRYPFVEILTGFLFAFAGFISYYQYGNNLIFNLFSSWILISLLISISLIDIDELIIPNCLVIPGILLGFVLPFLSNDSTFVFSNISFSERIYSSMSSLLLFSAISCLGEKLFNKPILGLGDAKLFAFSGAWLGFYGIELVGIISVLTAGCFSLMGLTIGFLKRGSYIPYGPFISFSIILVWSFGVDSITSNLGNFLWWRYL